MQNFTQLYLNYLEAQTFEEREEIKREIIKRLQEGLSEKEAEWWVWLLNDFVKLKKENLRLRRKLELIRELAQS